MSTRAEHEPEDNGREEAAVGIHLALDGAEPERVAEGIDQSAGQGAGFHDDELSQRLHPSVLAHQLACQMADTPEEEHDTGSAEEGAHDVNHQSHQRWVAHELSEEIGRKHEERCPRRVTDFQLIGCGDELWAVPETARWLYRAAIDVGSDGKSEPTHQVIDKSEMSHSRSLYYIDMCKIPRKGTTILQ